MEAFDIRGLTADRRLPPVFLSGAIIAVLAVYYWQMLPVGTISSYDEYYTLDRSNSFLVMDDWLTVYSNNAPSFRKPPLQYWMSAVLLDQGVNIEFALRFPSYLFGLLTLVCVGVLAALIYPANLYVAPAAIALLAGSSRFWENAISALLDTGTTFFSVLAVTAGLLALRNPRWWYVAALAVGLGALQKAPVSLLLLLVVIGCALASPARDGGAAAFRNRHFWISAALALALVLSWPLLQLVRHGAESFQEAYVREMFQRFSPVEERAENRGVAYALAMLNHVVLAGEAGVRLVGICAVLALPWILRRIEALALALIVLGFIAMVGLASGPVYPRYSLIVLPVIAAGLAAATLKLLPGRVLPLAVIALFAFASWGPFKDARALGLMESSQTKLLPLLQSIGEALGENEHLIVCNRHLREKWVARGAVSYYASKGRPFTLVHAPEKLEKLEGEGVLAPPYRGLCAAEKFGELTPLLPGFEIVEEFDGYIHWRIPGAPPVK